LEAVALNLLLLFRNAIQNSKQELELFDHLEQSLIRLSRAIGTGARLVGASGTFDVLGDLFGEKFNAAITSVSAEEVLALYEEAAAMTEEDRLADERIPNDRADMIVVAIALIVHVLRQCPQSDIYTCNYALKEGALLELASQHP